MISIRQASLEDLDRIHEIEKTSFSNPWSRRNLELDLGNKLLTYYEVILIHGIVIGYMGAYVFGDEAHISNVAIDLDFRESGYGTRLLDHYMESLQARGVKDFTLEVRDDNMAALKLYASQGFVPEGVRKNYYADLGRDAIVMWKREEEA